MARPLVKLLVQPTRIIRSHVIRILGRQERGPRSITKTGCEDRPILIKDASDGCHFRCCCCVFCREPLQNQGYFFSQVDLLIPQLRTGTEKVSTVSFSQKESKESRAAGLLGRSGRGIDHIQLPLFRSMVLLPALYFTHLCYTKLVPLLLDKQEAPPRVCDTAVGWSMKSSCMLCPYEVMVKLIKLELAWSCQVLLQQQLYRFEGGAQFHLTDSSILVLFRIRFGEFPSFSSWMTGGYCVRYWII